MQTRKLYYENAYTKTFDAEVLSCEETTAGFAVVLSATAFFPEEGGQTADTGTLDGVRVLDVREKAGIVTHRTEGPLMAGQTVSGALDWNARMRKMQNHTGEHIVSGLVHQTYGFSNVGFHLGEDGMTFDYDGALTRAQLDELEDEANALVWADLPVLTRFPPPEELKTLDYRSKLTLTANVRIVEIPGVDVCACCAPHVSSTGRVGAVKLLDFMRHRGGVRIWAKCGADVISDYRARVEAAMKISALLSVPQADISGAVQKLLTEQSHLKALLAALQKEKLDTLIASLTKTEGDLLLFADTDEDGLRSLVNAGVSLCGGICAAFSGTDGAYRFVLGSRSADVRQTVLHMKDPLKARGGGKAAMAMGSSAASRAEIEAYFRS